MQKLKYLVLAALFTAAAPAAAADPEHNGECAMSAVLGNHRPTSCAVVWISPSDKLYCFSNEQAKQMFMRDPEANERKAQAFWKDPALWEKIQKGQPEG